MRLYTSPYFLTKKNVMTHPDPKKVWSKISVCKPKMSGRQSVRLEDAYLVNERFNGDQVLFHDVKLKYLNTNVDIKATLNVKLLTK